MSAMGKAAVTPKLSTAPNYRLRKLLGFGLLGLFLAWLLVTFLIFPTGSLLIQTLFPNGQFSSETLQRIIASERVMRALRNSFLLAVLVCLTINLLGIFEILVLEYWKVRGARWLRFAYFAPLVCGGVTLVMAYSFMVGQRGYLTAIMQHLWPGLDQGWFIGLGGVLFELTFTGTTNHILFVTTAIRALDNQMIEAARCMGISAWRILWKIVLPSLKPSLFAVTVLTFAMGIAAFVTPQVLGGPQFQTINPLVLSFSNSRTTKDFGAILALFLGIVTALIMLVFNRIEARGHYLSVSKVAVPLKKQTIANPVVNWVVTIVAHAAAVIHILPLIFIVIFSFMPASDLFAGTFNLAHLTLKNYALVFATGTGLTPLIVSIVYSAAAAFLSVALILLIARVATKYKNVWTGILNWVVFIPWFLPGTLIALGLVQTFIQPSILTGGIVLQGTVFLLLIGYVIMSFPFTFRMIRAAYAGVGNSLEEAARNLGANTLSTFVKVLLPILMPTALMVFLQLFIGNLAEYEVSVFLFQPRFQPLGMVIYAATGPDAGPDAQVMTFVYAVVLMILAATALWFVNTYSKTSKKSPVRRRPAAVNTVKDTPVTKSIPGTGEIK